MFGAIKLIQSYTGLINRNVFKCQESCDKMTLNIFFNYCILYFFIVFLFKRKKWVFKNPVVIFVLFQGTMLMVRLFYIEFDYIND